MLNIKLQEKYTKKVLEKILLNSCINNHAQLIKINEGKKYNYSCSNCKVHLVKGESERTRKTSKGNIGRGAITIIERNQHLEICKCSLAKLNKGYYYTKDQLTKLIKSLAINKRIPIKTNNAFNSTFDYTCNQCKEFHIKAEWRKAVGFFQVVKYAVEHNEQCKTVDYKQSGFKRTLPSTKELMQDPHIINGAMVRHLGQSKPRDATQTAQTSFRRNYDLISPGLPDEKLLYGRAKRAERKLTMKAVGSWDDYSKIKSWKSQVEENDPDAAVGIFHPPEDEGFKHARTYSGLYLAPGSSVRYVKRLIANTADLLLLQHMEIDSCFNTKESKYNDKGTSVALTCLSADKKIIILLMGHCAYNEGNDLYMMVRDFFDHVYGDILIDAYQAATFTIYDLDIFVYCDKEKAIENFVESLEIPGYNFQMRYGIMHRIKHLKKRQAFKSLLQVEKTFALNKLKQLVHCTTNEELQNVRMEFLEATGLVIADGREGDVAENYNQLVEYLWQTHPDEWTNIAGEIRGKSDSSAAESTMNWMRQTNALKCKPLQQMNHLRLACHKKVIADSADVKKQQKHLQVIRIAINNYALELADLNELNDIEIHHYAQVGVGGGDADAVETRPVFSATVQSRFVDNKSYNVTERGCDCGVPGIHFHICRHQYRVLYNFDHLHTIANLHQHMYQFMSKEHQVGVYEDMINVNFKQINIDELEVVPHSFKRGTILPSRKKKRKVWIGNGARGQYTCGLCGQKGHQSGTCSSVIQPRPPSPCDAYCTCEIRWNNANV